MRRCQQTRVRFGPVLDQLAGRGEIAVLFGGFHAAPLGTVTGMGTALPVFVTAVSIMATMRRLAHHGARRR